MLVNIVSGQDNLAAYGDAEGDQAQRYARTREFMRLVRRLWTEEDVTFAGEHFQVAGSTVAPRPTGAGDGRHPRLYFGGASEAAEQVAATEADVQLFWGEPLDGIAERIDRLKALSRDARPRAPPLEFGLRITTAGARHHRGGLARRARRKVAEMADRRRADLDGRPLATRRSASSGCWTWPRAARCWTTASTPRPAGSAAAAPATTWLVGSHDDVAAALRKYQDLGITHFVLSDTPYQREAARIGDELLSRLRAPVTA